MQRIAVKNAEPAASRAVSAQFIPTNGSDRDEPSLAAGAAAQLEGQRVQGLSEQEAAQRLKTDGYNELPSTKRKSVLAIAFEVMREPMFLLLVVSGGLYLFLGDIQEALMLLGFVFVVIGITIYQERKTERALEALRDLSSPRALVIRDGEQQRIAGREVVCGDIVVVAEGDRVPADAVVLACRSLSVDESLLTGESVSGAQGVLGRRRHTWGGPAAMTCPSSIRARWSSRARAWRRSSPPAAAPRSARSARRCRRSRPKRRRLQTETGRLVRYVAIVGLLMCLVVITVYGLTRGDWLNGCWPASPWPWRCCPKNSRSC